MTHLVSLAHLRVRLAELLILEHWIPSEVVRPSCRNQLPSRPSLKQDGIVTRSSTVREGAHSIDRLVVVASEKFV